MSLLFFLCTTVYAQTQYKIVDSISPIFDNKEIIDDMGYEDTKFYVASPEKESEQLIEIKSQDYLRDKNIKAVQDTFEVISAQSEYENCDIAIVNFYFVLKGDYRALPKPKSIAIANTDYYVFLCQGCSKSTKAQMEEAYKLITQRACTRNTIQQAPETSPF
jgi:hypothetical protein